MLVDVYSYDEDDMVEDCKIKEHLAHFGINIKNMEKVIIMFFFITINILTNYSLCAGFVAAALYRLH